MKMIFSKNELELLPFPLASIIRLYEVELSPRMKSFHLFNFYEALSEFISTILLSSLNQNLEYSFRHFTPIKIVRKDWFKTPSIGNWNLINRTITKSLRRLREDSKNLKVCIKNFGYPSEKFIDNITNKDIYAIINDIRIDRNNWKGHSGFYGEKKTKELLNKHTKYLISLKPCIISLFSSFELFYALEIKYQKGIYNQKIKSIMGSSNIFDNRIFKAKKPMEYQNLYLLHEGSDEPIKLIPFVKFVRGPNTNKEVFYFYGRRDQHQIRYISFHDEEDPETILDIDTEFEDAFLFFQLDRKLEEKISIQDEKKVGEKYKLIFDELLTKFKKEKPGSTYRSSTVDSWLGLPIGTTGFHLEWSFIGTEPNKKLEIGIHLENELATLNHNIFDFLQDQEDQFTNAFGDQVSFLKEWINSGEWSKIFILKDVETLNRFMRDQTLKDWAFDNMVKFYDLYMKYQKEIKKQVYQMRSLISLNEIPENVKELNEQLLNFIRTLSEDIVIKRVKLGYTIYSPQRVFIYIYFRKNTLRLMIFTRGEIMEDVETAESGTEKIGGQKWGYLRLGSNEDFEKHKSKLRKSYEYILDAVACNESTGYYAKHELE